VRPVNATVCNPISLACDIACTTFAELPLVEMPTATSPGRAKASSCRAKTWSNPRSFPMAVTQELFTDKAKAGKAGRSNAKRPTSSAAICCASAALPPLPNSKTLSPCRNALTSSSDTFAIVERVSLLRNSSCFVVIDASINSVTRGMKSFACFMHPPQSCTASVQATAHRATRTPVDDAFCILLKGLSTRTAEIHGSNRASSKGISWMQGRRFRREFRGDEHAKLPVWLYYDQLAEFVLYQSVTIAVHRRAVHGPWSRVAQFDRHSNHSSSLFFQPD